MLRDIPFQSRLILNSSPSGGLRLVFAFVVVIAVTRWQNLPGDVVSVLLSVEHTPTSAEWSGRLRAQEATDCGVTVGYEKAGDFVVALILVAWCSNEAGINRGRGVAALGKDPDWLFSRAVIRIQIEEIGRVECIALCVQGVARIFYKNDFVCGPEGAIVESAMSRVTLVKQ